MRISDWSSDVCSSDLLYGVLDLGDPAVEAPATVAERIRGALKHIDAERLIVAPDCGMNYLPRAIAFGQLHAMVAGADMVRTEVVGCTSPDRQSTRLNSSHYCASPMPTSA